MSTVVKATGVKTMAGLEKVLAGLPAEYSLKITLVYEEAQTRRWAREVLQRIERMASPGIVRPAWWKIDDLMEPGVLAGAVSTAVRSDMIVVGIHSSEGLPLPFYFWANSWLPYRCEESGALVALLNVSSRRSPKCGRLRNYLKTVASQARMDFLLEEAVLVGHCDGPHRLAHSRL